ncbi:MAG TPA: hypothetical protein VGR87_06465 [Candidatus Limnocylindria bacterium]|nr:hypothetical protein [Candidatus Limnocylindria bacterium]
MKQVPYATIRLAGGTIATAWCAFVFLREQWLAGAVLGIVAFAGGWVVARRFARPVGKTDAPPWLDTVLPIAIAGVAMLEAALFPFVGKVSIAGVVAIVVLFLAGMSISLGLGPYANEKVSLVAKEV